MRSLAYIPVILVLALLLGACGNTLANVPTLETPRERLVALEIGFQEANRTIQDLVAAGTLHGPAAAHVADGLEAVHTALRAARAGVDGPDGLALLKAVNEALVGLTARLRAEEAQ